MLLLLGAAAFLLGGGGVQPRPVPASPGAPKGLIGPQMIPSEVGEVPVT